MNSKECRTTRQEIEQSELHERLSDPALRHIGSCPACRDFHGERTRLRELVGSLEPVVAPGDFDMRLRARIAAEQNNGARASFFRFVLSTPAMAVAALVVMLTGSILLLVQHQRDQQTSIATATTGRIEESIKPADKSATTGNTTLPIVDRAPNPLPTIVAKGTTSRKTSSKSAGSRGLTGPAADFYTKGAESIRQGEQRTGEVSLSAPAKPLVVSLEDNRGAKRKISLPPVSFGSQRLVDNRVPVSSNNSRSW